MKVVFSYNIDKDVENIIKATKSVNNKQPTKFQNLYIQKYGDSFEADKIKLFVEGLNAGKTSDLNKEISAAEERWKPIEPAFIERVEKIFGVAYPFPWVTAYLTHDQRCTYNIDGNYFFIKIGTTFSNNTVMHELLHFYTWFAFGKKLIDRGLPKSAYNDIKESLTELLNLEFADLMNGEPDKGYAKHQRMRTEVHRLWLEHRNLSLVIKELVSYKF